MTDPGYLWRWEGCRRGFSEDRVGRGKEDFSRGSSPYPWMEKGLTRKPVYYTYIEIMISVFTLVER
ncbi:hypothetical protein DRQ23_05775 [bacterium]|nr:MAG: hypothetical protein DRQ23_05775 [bacterium]